MNVQAVVRQLSEFLALPEYEIVCMSLLALIDQKIRQAEQEIDVLKKRYDVTTASSLHQAIQERRVAVHPAWEDYVAWKNKQALVERLQQIAEGRHTARGR